MTDTVTLTGPESCAQCGQEIDAEAVLAEAGGTELIDGAYVTVKGHHVPVPGLYWDKACGDQIKAGELEPSITCQAAQTFLDETWGPMVTGAMLLALAAEDEELAASAAARLADILEVSHLLDAVIELQNSPGGLDEIPECDGHHGHGQDHAKAHLS